MNLKPLLSPWLRTALFAFALIFTRAGNTAPDARSPYVANGCYQCHGYSGQGGAGARLARTAYSFEAFAALVRRPANEMPAYAPEVLDDAKLRSIYDYLRSLPEPPRVSLP
jgi:mono/diheme cytochrome c family protein